MIKYNGIFFTTYRTLKIKVSDKPVKEPHLK